MKKKLTFPDTSAKTSHFGRIMVVSTDLNLQENVVSKLNIAYGLFKPNMGWCVRKWRMDNVLFVSSGLAVALQLLHGDIDQLRREYMAIFTRGVSITRKLGFSDVIMPGEKGQSLLF